MALTALPSDCLLACLARVPYVDLRNTIPSTCKSLRDAVTSAALRKTREAAGWTEWAVFAGRPTIRSDCYIITASGARRTVRRSHVYCEDALRASLSSDQDEVVLMECENGSVRACVFDPRQDSWRYISPLLLVQNVGNQFQDDIERAAVAALDGTDDIERAAVAALGGSIMVLGGTSERDFHVYDSAQDTWSRQPPPPFDSCRTQSIEVAGRLWCYASEDHLQETFIYDPETCSWTAGPRLPFELYDGGGGVHWHTDAFEVHGKFCIMAYFELTPGTAGYSAFVWDPAREAWDEAPFPVPPVVGFDCSQIDGHLIVSSNHPSEQAPVYSTSGLARLFVLSPGSTEWTEWRLPDGVANATRVAAVRIG